MGGAGEHVEHPGGLGAVAVLREQVGVAAEGIRGAGNVEDGLRGESPDLVQQRGRHACSRGIREDAAAPGIAAIGAKKVVELGGSVNTLVEEQKKAQEAAREMAAAQKKVAEAMTEAAAAYGANDLKGYIAAMKKVGGDYTQGMQKGSFTATDSNIQAFSQHLKDQLAQADFGSALYQNLTKQLADANMLANLLQTAVKNGIDIAQFDPQGLFNKIFGENPGDYIDDAKWEELRKKIEELVGKPITIDVNTGEVSLNGKSKDESGVAGTKNLQSLVGNVSTITGALKELGVEVPEGFTKVLGVMQVITTIMMAIQSLATITATTSALKSIPIIGWFLQNGGVVHAANGFSGIVPGNSFSGDNIPAMLNAGETVLTRAQSGVIASALQAQDNGMAGGMGEVHVESDEMVLLLRNGAARRGMTIGEYLGL